MIQQETGGGGTGEPTLTEEVQSEGEAQNPARSTDAPAGGEVVLNRAERRAQAKGKKGGAAAGPAQPLGGARTNVAKPSGHAGQVRFPRTGHK